MPRPGPRKPLVAIRLDPDRLSRIDELAKRECVNRSEMIRLLVQEALTARGEP